MEKTEDKHKEPIKIEDARVMLKEAELFRMSLNLSGIPIDNFVAMLAMRTLLKSKELRGKFSVKDATEVKIEIEYIFSMIEAANREDKKAEVKEDFKKE